MGGKGSGRKRLEKLETAITGRKSGHAKRSPYDERTPVDKLLSTEIGWYTAGVDYYRATSSLLDTPVADVETAKRWVMDTIEAFGVVTTPPKPRAFLDYRGYQIDSVFCGVRPDGVMFQVSGGLARSGWRMVPTIAKPTRIDLHLTVAFEYDMPFLAAALGKEASMFEFGQGREPDLTLYHSYREKGDTLSVGSRESAVYGRVYDKYRESGNSTENEFAWRWEVELKKEACKDVLVNYRDSLGRDSAVASIVSGLFADRGVVCPGLYIPLRGIAKVPARPETDYESKIAWLRRTVAPTVMKLRADGANEQYLAALLGIEDIENVINEIEERKGG